MPAIQLMCDVQSLLNTVGAIVLIVVLIAHYKLNSTIALTLGALGLGWVSGMKLNTLATSFESGLGAILGQVSMVIGLGAILGKMLEVSGGADVIAERIAQTFGPKRANWAVLTAAIVIGIPVFFSVGFMLLLPIVIAMSRRNAVPFMKLGFPLIAALSSMHACVPPSHPGPMAAIGALNTELARIQLPSVNIGRTVLLSLVAGIPMAMLSGLLYAKWVLKRVNITPHPPSAQESQPNEPRSNEPRPTNEPRPQGSGPAASSNPSRTPSFSISLFTILLPILLVLLANAADRLLPNDSTAKLWLSFFGGPTVAMLTAVLVSFYTFGVARGFNATEILKFSNDCMTPIAATLLVVGAGGGFNQILKDCRVSDAIVHFAMSAKLHPLLLGWLVAALIRLAVGSSTVAITTAVGIVAPLAVGHPGISVELLVVAMGAGSLMLSHVNDGGFWIVKEFFGLSVEQTFKTWSVGTIIGSFAGLLITLLLQFLIR